MARYSLEGDRDEARRKAALEKKRREARRREAALKELARSLTPPSVPSPPVAPRPSVGRARRSLAEPDEAPSRPRGGGRQYHDPTAPPALRTPLPKGGVGIDTISDLLSRLPARWEKGIQRLQSQGSLAAEGQVHEDLVGLVGGPNLQRVVEGRFDEVDPWIALEIAGILPLGKVFGMGAQAGGIAMRRLSKDVAIPAAGSAAGRLLEEGMTAIRPTIDEQGGAVRGALGLLRPRSRAERAAQEFHRTQAKTTARVMGTPDAMLQRWAAKLTPEEHYALMLDKDKVPLAQRVQTHVDELAKAEDAGDVEAIANLNIHGKMIKGVQDQGLITVGSDGLPVLSKKALSSRKMRESSRLIDKSDANREAWLDKLHEDLPDLFPPRAARQARQDKFASVWAGEDVVGTGQYHSMIPGVPGTAAQIPQSPLGTLMRPFMSSKASQALKQTPKLAPGEGKKFTGRTILRGNFRTDLAQQKAEHGITVLRAKNANDMRHFLLNSEFTIDALPPDAAFGNWIPVYTDEALLSGKVAGESRGQLTEAMRILEQAAKGGDVSADEILRGKEAFERFRKIISPMGDNDTLQSLVVMAKENGGRLEGMRWAPVDSIRGLGLLDPHPRVRNFISRGDNKVARTFGGAIQDYNRAFLLYLNPAYATVNFVSNVGMDAIQQGVFMPRNIKVAGELWWKAGHVRKEGPWSDVIRSIDVALGEGQFLATTQSVSLSREITGRLARGMGAITDIGPRRLAFVHEAHREGYKNADQIGALMTAGMKGDDKALGEIDKIARRAKDALGDYERATHPLERNVLTNALMFYPWLRASLRWSARLPMDHPFQAAGIAYAGKEYKELSEEQRAKYGLDIVPKSLEGYMAIGVRDDGSVYGFDPKNVFTGSQPVDLARALYAFGRGDPALGREVLGQFNPFVQAGVTSLTGRDPFGKEVGVGPSAFLGEISGIAERSSGTRFAQLLADKAGLRDFKETSQSSLFPRTKTDEWVSIAAGRSTGPKPVNPEKAKEYAIRDMPKEQRREERATINLEETADELRRVGISDAEIFAYSGGAEAELELEQHTNDLYALAKKEMDVKTLTTRQKLAYRAQAAIDLLRERGDPSAHWMYAEMIAAETSQDLSDFEDIIDEALDALQITAWRELKSEARAEGAKV